MSPSRLNPAPSPSRLRWLVLAMGLAFGGAAQAQSLQELYQAAHDYDANYLMARANVNAVDYRRQQAQAVWMPAVNLGISGARNMSGPVTPLSASQNTTGVSATLNGQQNLYNRADQLTISQAERAVQIARADLQSAEQDLIMRVSQAYFDVLAAQDNLTTAKASLSAIAEQVASAKRNFEVGTATITDTREAQARYDLGDAQRIQAENDLLTKRILLDQTVGRHGTEPRPLATPVIVPPVLPADAEQWVQRADSEHPALQHARLALDTARLAVEKARAGHLPTVALAGSYGRSRASVSGQSIPAIGITAQGDPIYGAPVGYSESGTTVNRSIGITVTIPLFSGFSVQNAVKEKLALETVSIDDLEGQRRMVAQATRTAYFGALSGAAQVNAYEAAESSSKLALEATQLGFKVGVRVNLDVLNAQAQLYTTQSQLAKARYDLILAGLRLRQAAGVLAPGDVTAVNQLLRR